MPRYAPAAVLVALALAFFCRVLLSGRALSGHDLTVYFYPLKEFIRAHLLERGALPFWNPFQFSGTPLIANIQASLFYPGGILFYIMPAVPACLWTIIIHCVLGSLFMYLFMRSLDLHPAGAFLASVIFIYNGYFMAHLYAGHLTLIQSYVWIPLVFLFLIRFAATGRFSWAVYAALALGAQLLAGFPQISFYTMIAVLGFGLTHAGIRLRTGPRGDAGRVGIGVCAVIAAAFALAAIQLLPTAELAGLTARAGGMDYAFATADSLHPRQFLTFIAPNIFGNPIDGTYWVRSTGWHFWETCAYVGILPLVLALVPLYRRTDLRNLRYFCMGMIAVSLFLAMGAYNPLFPLVFKLPGFRGFRIPAQILYLYVFGIAVLAGMAVHEVRLGLPALSRTLKVSCALAAAVVLMLLVAAHARPYHLAANLIRTCADEIPAREVLDAIPAQLRTAITWSAIMCAVAGAALVLLRRRIIDPARACVLLAAIVVIDLAVFSIRFVGPCDYRHSKDKQHLADRFRSVDPYGRAMISRELYHPNDGMTYRIRAVDGYDPLALERYMRLLQESQQMPVQRHAVVTPVLRDYRHPLLAMLRLRFACLPAAPVRLEAPLPPAVLVPRARAMPADEILPYMMRPDFDPRTEVLLEPQDTAYVIAGSWTGDLEGECGIVEYESERLKVRASCSRSCWLLLTEIFYPGWRARVDGRPSPVLRGNYVFRVVPLEAGTHEIEMRFVSRPFRVGAVVSLLALLCCAAFALFMRR